MKNTKYLNEEKYEQGKTKITKLAKIILAVGLCVGIGLITLGVVKICVTSYKYSEKGIESVRQEVLAETEKLNSRKNELKNNGVTFDNSTTYEDPDAYELKLITEVLDPSFNYWKFDEYSDNSFNPVTAKYCELREELYNISSGYKKSYSIGTSVPFIMIGVFICFATLMISGKFFMVTKGRDILAFTTQQAMPVAKEGLEQMAPIIGDVAKEVAEGIKEGLGSDSDNK